MEIVFKPPRFILYHRKAEEYWRDDDKGWTKDLQRAKVMPLDRASDEATYWTWVNSKTTDGTYGDFVVLEVQ